MLASPSSGASTGLTGLSSGLGGNLQQSGGLLAGGGGGLAAPSTSASTSSGIPQPNSLGGLFGGAGGAASSGAIKGLCGTGVSVCGSFSKGAERGRERQTFEKVLCHFVSLRGDYFVPSRSLAMEHTVLP